MASLLHWNSKLGRLDRCRKRVQACPYGGPVAVTMGRDRSGKGEASLSEDFAGLPVASMGAGKLVASYAKAQGRSVMVVQDGKLTVVPPEEASQVLEEEGGPSELRPPEPQVPSLRQRLALMPPEEREALLARIDEEVVPLDKKAQSEAFRAWSEDASREELSALHSYSRVSYGPINAWLAGDEASVLYPQALKEQPPGVEPRDLARQEQELEALKAQVVKIDGLMEREAAKENPLRALYRGLSYRETQDGRAIGEVPREEAIEDLMARFPVGGEVESRGYSSTSASEKVAKKFGQKDTIYGKDKQPVVLILRARTRQGVCLAPISRIPGEEEVLLPQGVKFLVMKTSLEGKRNKTLYVDVVDEEVLKAMVP